MVQLHGVWVGRLVKLDGGWVDWLRLVSYLVGGFIGCLVIRLVGSSICLSVLRLFG